jgi:deoxycytidine triphosphate deaminase
MDRNEALKQKAPRDLEIERLSKYPTAPYQGRTNTDDHRASGVLLSDEILYYCQNYSLLDPFEAENIKPANYELRVGFNYAVNGKKYEIQKGEELTIPPFEVAVIEILETVNMPPFLIGRWNIRVSWAYEGLVWVGGPQVDAGFRGILLCPIWNLSNKPFRIKSGEAIAVIDFQTTTPLTTASKIYKWAERKRFVFQDYKPEALLSGLAPLARFTGEELHRLKADISSQGENIRSRVDYFVVVTFTALGILTAAITILITRPSDAHFWDPAALALSTCTLVVALMAWTRKYSKGDWWWGAQAALLAFAILALGIQVYRGEKEQNRLQEQQTRLKGAEVEVQQLRLRVDTLEKTRSIGPESKKATH